MPFNCLLIGQDNVLIECAEHLLKAGHQIKWVVSNFSLIQAWCLKNKIAYLDSIDQLLVEENKQVDYIFSIVNEIILKREVLNLAKISTFNYHDALLPQYAGVHATNWALLNGEPFHGITWHLVNEGIDEGDIVYQTRFPILENDTALTLNLRCFEEAIKGFSILIAGLETATLTPQKQCLSKRSYYGKYAILPNLGFINWQSDAALIKRTCNALHFGNYDNSLGTLKLYLESTYLIIVAVEILPYTNENKPGGGGIILALDEKGLLVSTNTQAILIKKMLNIQGKTVASAQLAEQYGLMVGSQLPQLDDQSEIMTEARTRYLKSLKQEKSWLNKLQNIVEHSSFTERFWNKKEKYTKLVIVENKSGVEGQNDHTCLLASLLVYLLRINNYEPYTVFLSQGQFKPFPLFSEYLPMTVDWASNSAFTKVLKEIDFFLTKFCNESFLSDLTCRHPSLGEKKQLISIRLANTTAPLPENSMLHFEINNELAELTLYYRLDLQSQGGLLGPLIENLPQHFAIILEALHDSPNGMIHAFPLVTEEEKRQLFEWGVGEYIDLPARCFHV